MGRETRVFRRNRFLYVLFSFTNAAGIDTIVSQFLMTLLLSLSVVDVLLSKLSTKRRDLSL